MPNTNTPLELLVKIEADTAGSKANLQQQLKQLSKDLQMELGISLDGVSFKSVEQGAESAFKKVQTSAQKAASEISAEFASISKDVTKTISDIERQFKGKDFTIKTDFDVDGATRTLKGVQVDVKQTEDLIERVTFGLKQMGNDGDMQWVQTSVKNINAEAFNLSKQLNNVTRDLRIMHQEGKISTDTFNQMTERAKSLTNSTGFKELGNDIKVAVSEHKVLTNEIKEQEKVERQLQSARQKTLDQLERMSQSGKLSYSQAGAFTDTANTAKSIDEMNALRQSVALAAQDYNKVTKEAGSASVAFTNLNHRIEDLVISTRLSSKEADIWRSKFDGTTSASGIKEINRDLTVSLNKQKQLNNELKEQEANQKKLNQLINQMIAAQNKNPKAFAAGTNPEFDNLMSQARQLDPVAQGAKKSIDDVSNSFNRMKAEATSAGRESMTVMDSFRIAMEKFPVWMAASTAFYGTMRGIRDVFTQIVELDSQMTVLSRVAGDGADVNKVLSDTVDLAGKLGNQITDINEGFIAFARQGFRGDELTNMAEYATLLGNISDLTVEDSASILTAGMKAFNIEAENSIRIVDSLNEVDKHLSLMLAIA